MKCPKCQKEFNPVTKWGYTPKFCSRKCSNSHIVTDKHKEKVSKTLRKHIRWDYAATYTKVYRCTCKFSKRVFYSTTPKHVHPELARDKKEYSYSCQFKFGISSYPAWFTNASQLIKDYGWYSTPGSRKGKTNTNGISRDHLYSITDGWINNVPPSIIRHPANCALIPHKENQRKHKQSKITLDELQQRIAEFEANGYR